MKKHIKFILLICLGMFLITAGKKDDNTFSIKQVEEDMVLIPQGKFNFVPYFFDSVPSIGKAKEVNIASFYISKYEASNLEYSEFLTEMKKTGKTTEYKIANVDSTQWRGTDPYTGLYHAHPAYKHYPVVTISYDGAIMFCAWLTAKYNAHEKRKFNEVIFRLPTEMEWIYAANGGLVLSNFPWAWPYITNSSGGDFCNYKKILQLNIYQDDETRELKIIDRNRYWTGLADNADITVPIKSYYPNNYGLYNMGGNAAEMVEEKGISKGGSWASTGYYIQNNVKQQYEGPSNALGFRYVMEILEE